MTAYSFVNTQAAKPKESERVKFDLLMRQQPDRARVCTAKERERRPVDPPPIIQLQVQTDSGLSQNYLQNPHLFMCATLVHSTKDEPVTAHGTGVLAGTHVSSLYRLKDIDNTDGGFFVFADLSIKVEGLFRLKFSLFDISSPRNTTSRAALGGAAQHLASILSQPFMVHTGKSFPGMLQSTFLSRSFSDQGVRIRIRKEHRIQMRPQEQSPKSSQAEHHQLVGEGMAQASLGNSSLQARVHGDPYSAHHHHQQQHHAHSPTEVHGHLPGPSYVVRSARRLSQGYHPYYSLPHSPDMAHAPRWCESPTSGVTPSSWPYVQGSTAHSMDGRFQQHRSSTDQHGGLSHHSASISGLDPYRNSRRSSQNSSLSTGGSNSPDRTMRLLSSSAPVYGQLDQPHGAAMSTYQLPTVHERFPPLEPQRRSFSGSTHQPRLGLTQDLFRDDIGRSDLKLPPLHFPPPHDVSHEHFSSHGRII